ncbi:hypothetical protein [Deinococcus aerolatus]|nr:hypothetical protein [Deinococcus aerolatus]
MTTDGPFTDVTLWCVFSPGTIAAGTGTGQAADSLGQSTAGLTGRRARAH